MDASPNIVCLWENCNHPDILKNWRNGHLRVVNLSLLSFLSDWMYVLNVIFIIFSSFHLSFFNFWSGHSNGEVKNTADSLSPES